MTSNDELAKHMIIRNKQILYSLLSVLLPSGLLLLISLHNRVTESNYLQFALSLRWVAVISLLVAISALTYCVLKRKKNNEEDDLEPLIQWNPRSSHIVQSSAQGIVYVAWVFAWPVAQEHLVLLFAQICFAYLCDSSISWFKHGNYRLNLAPIPIVFSTNLFLFFKDDYFLWQWVLIGGGLLSRELFRWKREGRDVHISNPSAIALSLCALVLINTESMHL